MTVKPIAVVLLAFLFSVPAWAQKKTARQYFDEMRDANVFVTHLDKYACFRDEEAKDGVPSFFVVNATEDVMAQMEKNKDKAAQDIKKAGKGLFIHNYLSGVSNGEPQFFPKVEGDYSLDSGPPLNLREVYTINWKTGRYLLRIYVLKSSKDLPANTSSGKCELIHPWDTPSVLAK